MTSRQHVTDQLPWPVWGAINLLRFIAAFLPTTMAAVAIFGFAGELIDDFWSTFAATLVFYGITVLPGALLYLFALGFVIGRVEAQFRRRLAAFIASPLVVIYPLSVAADSSAPSWLVLYSIMVALSCATVARLHRRLPGAPSS